MLFYATQFRSAGDLEISAPNLDGLKEKGKKQALLRARNVPGQKENVSNSQ